MENMKVSEIIVRILELRGYKHVFMVTGGGSMHLNDSFGRSKLISVVPLHHEQSCSIAAESYYRTANLPAIVNVTSGPGGINALTGVYGAYVDSIPLILISGQVRSDHLVKNIGGDLRQFGDQEADIISMSKPITKSSIQLNSRIDIVKVINDQITLAISDRPGPVWIDIPLDIQAAELDISINELTAKTKNVSINRQAVSKEQIKQLELLQNMLIQAKRPIIIAGNGIRLSNSVNKFHNLLEKLRIPACAVWNSHDLVSNDNHFFAGRPGADGERAGNFNMQNSDLLIILGARMHVRQVGFNHQSFARNAKKVMVDIDLQELNKPNLGIDLKIQMDLSSFFDKFTDLLDSKDHSYSSNNNHKSFLNWCKKNVQDLQVMQPHHYKAAKGTINPYLFVERLFERLDKNATVITGDGTAAVVTFKAAYLREGQRLYTNKGCANMGYDIPALIGSLHAKEEKKILITGDGSLMMNIQDLASLKPFKKKDIKIFVLNNSGYHSIRQTQINYFDNFEVGCGESTNLFFPDLRKIADCFDLDYFLVNDSKTLNKAIENTTKKLKLIEVIIDKNQSFEPRVESKKLDDGSMVSSPLEEMSPLLPKEEFLKRMLIKLSKDTNYE